jgi:tellurite methyltransferase
MQDTKWNDQWPKEIKGTYWKKPDQDVAGFLDQTSTTQYPNALDYGCGLGRHSILLAQKGFKVTAIDLSDNAIRYLDDWCKKENCILETKVADLTDDFFKDKRYHIILCYNVIYHCRREDLVRRVDRVWHNLESDSFFYFTVPTREDGKYGHGEEVAPHTFLCDKSIHPGDIHYFADEIDIKDILNKFSIHSLQRDEHNWINNGVEQFSSYWKVICKPKK